MQPTIVLVHGAFAESASWDGVARPLVAAGHRVIAAANPLRGLASDAASVSDLLRSIEGPVVLVAHSYGGMVATNVDPSVGDVAAIVYVGAFAPEPGESALSLSEMFPGSTLAQALQPIPRSDGTTDLVIRPERFHEQFAADVPAATTDLMAVTQRPVTQEALSEASGPDPLWRHAPSFFVFGEEDRNIPAALQHYMARRAGAHRAVEIPGASHALAVSHPEAIAHLVREAAATKAAA